MYFCRPIHFMLFCPSFCPSFLHCILRIKIDKLPLPIAKFFLTLQSHEDCTSNFRYIRFNGRFPGEAVEFPTPFRFLGLEQNLRISGRGFTGRMSFRWANQQCQSSDRNKSTDHNLSLGLSYFYSSPDSWRKGHRTAASAPALRRQYLQLEGNKLVRSLSLSLSSLVSQTRMLASCVRTA